MIRGVVLAAALAVAGSTVGPAAAVGVAVIEIPVSFVVRNVDETELLDCEAVDGAAEHVIRGHITGPASMLGDRARAITVYVHGSTIDESHWRAPELPHVDYARLMAEKGHTSLTFSELGYGDSGLPVGQHVCKGAQATILHQVVGQLREGVYRVAGPRRAFARVAIAGQSSGALTAQIAAYSFEGFDALVQIGWANVLAPTEPAMEIATHQGRVCTTGGERKHAERSAGPPGYAYAWPSAEAQIEDNWVAPASGVAEGFAAVRERDPCGAATSVGEAIMAGNAHLHEIDVPVLLLFGRRDKLFPPGTREQQAARFTGTEDFTFVELDAAGHDPVFDNGTEGNATEFRRVMSEWLGAGGF